MSPTTHTPPLATQRCSPQSGSALAEAKADLLLQQLPGWAIEAGGDAPVLTRRHEFPDFHHTMAFVNAVAWIAHEQDHHPDLLVTYNRCTVSWSTHSVGGLSINDFICAARVDALLA